MEKNKASGRKYLRYFLIFTAAVVSVALVYTSIAYMIKQTELTNRFTKRDFGIELLEPQYDLLPEESRNNLVPNDTVTKDPKVKNTEDTDAFVFLKVTVPVAEITKYVDPYNVDDPPTKHNDEIFYLKTTGTSLYGLSNVFNNTPADASDNGYWVELTGREEGTDLSGETRTYVFGYSVYLTPEEKSETLFDFVQLKNILQYELDPDDDIHIQVDAYGIQADYLEGINKNNGNNKAIMTQDQLNTIFGYILS